MPLKSYLFTALALFAITFSACKKKGAIEPKPEEEGLKVALENVAEGQYTAAPGSSYTFQVKINSVMPAAGVNIKVDAITDPGGIVFPQNPVAPSKDSVINITLVGLERLRTVKVTVTITSAGNENNKITKTFWITNKSDG
ncbi:hypothetical protein [Chitinophaga filiformis]|uniref:Uncharacterized protein n=1 Tax=Chitinophaga filiformis TaxID=104663 RepID=A0ABY4I4C1_CHIFI|nr:hypothetical protein [Chitinophaga filiformis]UPK70692.1 hypothetical protein MYF79_05195 [Chitinophaga filiformis]